MLKADYDYFNFNNSDDRLSLQEKSWNRSKELIIFDELHKLKNWKSWLKGVYDIEGIPPPILVTGSAKLDAYRKVGDSGIKLENTVACALQKEIHFREDCFGETKKLYYLKNKEKKEIDFCTTTDDTPSLLVEVKWKDGNLSPNFEVFKHIFPQVKMIQVTKELKREKTFPNGAEIRIAHNWLSGFSLP